MLQHFFLLLLLLLFFILQFLNMRLEGVADELIIITFEQLREDLHVEEPCQYPIVDGT